MVFSQGSQKVAQPAFQLRICGVVAEESLDQLLTDVSEKNVTVDLDASRQLWQEDVDWKMPVAEVSFDVEAPEDFDLQIDRLIFAVEDMASQLYRTSVS